MTHEKIKAALEFYANRENYKSRFVTEECGCCSYEHDPVMDDGERAREALALLEAQTSAGEEIEGLDKELAMTQAAYEEGALIFQATHEAARRYAASQQTRGEVPADNGGENCPDGMSCSGNGMDCVGDGLCKGPEVSHVNDINVADIPQAIENIGPNTTPEVSGEVDVDALFKEVKDYIMDDPYNGSDPVDKSEEQYLKGAKDTLMYIASRNLLKSEGVCVPGEIIERACRSIQSMLLDLENQAEIDYPEETRRYVSQQRKYDNALSSLQEYRDTLEALRPFLPAEKE